MEHETSDPSHRTARKIKNSKRCDRNLSETDDRSLLALQQHAVQKKIVIAGGGTGGHIYPAIGIAQALQRLDTTVDIVFIGGSDKLESTLVPQHGFRFLPISVAGLPRRLTLQWLPAIWKAVHGLLQSLRYMKELKPDVVIGTGGYGFRSGSVSRSSMQDSHCYPRTECFCWLNKRYIGTMGRCRLPCYGIGSREQFIPTNRTYRDNRKSYSSCNRCIPEARGNPTEDSGCAQSGKQFL